MGTRNLTIVISNGQTKVAQYGQWDGYPSGQGATVLEFLRKADINKFKEKVDSLTKWVTKSQLDKLYKDAGHTGGDWVNMEVSNKFKLANPQLDRDMAAEVLEYIYNTDKTVLLNNNSEFLKDGLFCEWAYIINLDKNTLEVKNGANKKYKLDKLPTNKKFIKECEGQEQD